MNKIMTEMGVALQINDKEVFINIYPHTNILVNISYEAALHMYKLVQKHNYVIQDYKKKWSPFWRNLTQVERTMTCLFLDKNSIEGLGRHFSFSNKEDLPQEFLDIKMTSKLPKISIEIKKELEAIYKIHVMAIVTHTMVKDYWEEHSIEMANLLKENGKFTELVQSCFDEEKIAQIINELLIDKKEWLLKKYDWTNEGEDTFSWLIKNEISLFQNTPYLLASYKK